jgi:membrane protease YdiL (CAAX protease family)
MVKRLAAVIEILAIFTATFVMIWLIALLPISQIPRWFISYAVMIGFPLLILILSRRRLSDYGLDFHALKSQLNITLTAFLPIAFESAIYGWFLPLLIPQAAIRVEGALILSLVEIAVLIWVAWALHRNTAFTPLLPICLAIIPLVQVIQIRFENLLGFLFYLIFLGPGEEFLFRGYIQSRLNRAFGRPFRFFGVASGLGVVITAFLFGLMHILNPFNPFLGKFDVYIWWGVWTFFGGLTLGYVREKSGSILPSAILHGLPQAIASLVLGFFAVR